MLGRYPRSLLHRTTSKGELHTQSHEIVHLPSSEDEKRMLQPPHQIVIGFDLGADGGRNVLHTQACESPRSVLEPHHLCFRSHNQSVQSPRSPLSALGSLLSSNPHSRPCTEGPALCLKVAIEADEGGAGVNSHHAFSTKGHVANGVDNASAYAALSKSNHMADYSKAKMQGERLTFSRPNYVGSRKNMPCNHGPSDHVHPGICANYPHSKTFLGSHCDEEDNDEATEEDVENEDVDIPVPIFSTASPVSNYYMCDSLAVDFLSKCFLCRRHLLQGKDIYMYRGDRAFCSQECRYQQIVIDERKERRPTAVTCVSGASGHHQRLQRTTQAAIV